MLFIWILTLLQQPISVASIPFSPSVSKRVEARYARRPAPLRRFPIGYYSNSTTENFEHESYQPTNVSKSILFAASEQVLAAAFDFRPDAKGFVVTTLEASGRASTIPLPTNSIPSPTALLQYAECTLKMSSEPTKPTNSASPNIFGAPIAISKPSKIFEERKDHPAPRVGIRGSGPYGTNKFYANFFLGNQSSPAYVHPYSLAWSRGQGSASSWGIAISHVEANQRVYGDTQPETGAAKYFLNPIGIKSLCLSASELGSKTSLTTDSINSHSANVNLHPDSKAKALVSFPMVQGMGFVTAIYNGGTPVIETGVLFKTVIRLTPGPQPGVTKYTFHLVDGKVWHVYGYSAKGDPFDLTVLNSRVAKAGKPFRGIVQVAKDPGDAESIIDAAAGAYPVGMVLSGTSSGSKGTYTFTYQKAGLSKVKLLMYALPHHYESFDDATAKATSTAKLQTTTKGMAKAVVADSWTMIESNMPVSMGFAPWDPQHGPKDKLSDSAIKSIAPVALKELSQNLEQQSNQDSMYFSGKVRDSIAKQKKKKKRSQDNQANLCVWALAKFAAICFTAKDLLKDPKLAQSGLDRLKSAFTRFISNKQQFPLYYECEWFRLGFQ